MTSEPDQPSLQGVRAAVTYVASLPPLLTALIATAVLSILFLLFPGFDIAVSASFYVPGKGFPAAGESLFRTLRSLGLLSINVSVILVVALTLARCLAPIRWLPGWLAAIRPRIFVFLVTTLALGPGIVTNVILKDHWGRARPVNAIAFGGTQAFSSPWIVSDACVRNCSFVSGEGSGAFWFLVFAFVVPANWRPAVAVSALCWATIISLNRIAFGGHFLSDVLIGWALMFVVILALRDLVLLHWGEMIDASIARWVGRAR